MNVFADAVRNRGGPYMHQLVRTVACPRCGALPQYHCRSIRNRDRAVHFHPQRRDAYLERIALRPIKWRAA